MLPIIFLTNTLQSPGRRLNRAFIRGLLFGLFTVWGSTWIAAQELLPIKVNDRWGFATAEGDTLVPPRYTFTWLIQPEYGILVDGGKLKGLNDLRGGLYGLVDDRGKVILPAKYQAITSGGQPGMFRVKVGDRWGIADKRGRWVAEPKYVSVTPYRNEVALAQQPNGAWVVLDDKGRESSPLAEGTPDTASFNGYAVSYRLRRGNQSYAGLKTLEMESVLPPEYDSVRVLSATLYGYKTKAADGSNQRMWGVWHLENDRVLPPLYSAVFAAEAPEEGLTGAMRDGKTAYLNNDGRMVLLPKLHSGAFSNGYAPARTNGKWGFINREQQWVIEAEYDAVTEWQAGFAAVKQNGKWGLVDSRGVIVQACQFQQVNFLSPGLAACFPAHGTTDAFQVYGADGAAILPAAARQVGHNAGLLWVSSSSSGLGYIGPTGNFRIEPAYDAALPFKNGFGQVEKGGRHFFVNTLGQKFPAEQTFEAIGPFGGNGLAPVQQEGKWGFLGENGKMVIEPQFQAATPFSEELAAVETPSGWGYINAAGEFVLPPRYQNATAFSEGLAAVKIADRWGYIYKNGRFAVVPRFTIAGPFSSGCARVSTYGNYAGYIDKEGRKVHHEVFRPDGSTRFASGFAAATRKGNFWIFLSKTGVRMTDWGKYRSAAAFSDGLAPIQLSPETYSYIRTDGRLAMDPLRLNPKELEEGWQAYLQRVPFSEGMAPFLQNGLYGYIDLTGRVLIPPKLQYAGRFSEGLAPAKGSAVQIKLGWYATDGTLLWPEMR